MLELAVFVIGLAGFGLAGYLDLKYTEFPGWIPYGIISTSVVVFAVDGLLTNSFSLLINSVLYGLIFLAIGLVMYFSKQWGDGDAWLLGSLGFTLPTRLLSGAQTGIFPFHFVLFFNFLVVCFVYIAAYCLFIGLRSQKVRRLFVSELRKGHVHKVVLVAVLSVFCAALYFYFNSILTGNMAAYLLLLPAIFAGFVLFADYTKVIENHIFRKKVLTKNLRPGDVVFGAKWTGLTKKDIKKIKKRYVIVKEGVRLAPVFLITFLLTILFGSLVWFV